MPLDSSGVSIRVLHRDVVTRGITVMTSMEPGATVPEHFHTHLVGTDRMVSPLRAWYAATLAGFLASDADLILGQLASLSDFAVLPAQRDAWLAQIGILHGQLPGLAPSMPCARGIRESSWND
jgi:hypothetical protein